MSFYRKTFDILLKKYKFLLFDSLGKNNTKKETIPYPICSVVAVFKMRMRLPSEQAVVFCSLPPSLCKDYWIHSFWSQHTEKRNNLISQMRLRSVFKMRMSILNTATTEQMGYGIISFFVCFLLNESNS